MYRFSGVVDVADNDNNSRASPGDQGDRIWRPSAEWQAEKQRMLEPNRETWRVLGRRIRLTGLLTKPLQIAGVSI
jgi:hypothetical protein